MKHEIFADEITTPSLRGGLSRFRPGRILFDKGRIVSVEKISARRLSLLSKKATRYRSIIPGLIDAHTHLVYAGNRTAEWALRLKGISYQEIAKKGGGIQKTVRETRAASEAELIRLAKRRLQECLKFGVTSLEIKSGYGLDLDTELRVLRSIQKLKKQTPLNIFSSFLGAHALPPEFNSNREYVDWLIKEVLPQISGLADFQDVFVEKGYFGVPESVTLLEAGKKYGLRPKVHAHEFGRTGGVEVACRVGAVSADHLQFMSAADIAKMKRAKVVPVLLPGTSVFLGAKKFAPARALWDAGLPVAIASDFNPGTNPSMNFPLAGSFAAIFESLNLDEVLTAQTRNAAMALDLKDRGILAPGFKADFVALDLGSFEEMYYHYGQSFVKAVYIDGKKVL